MILFLYPAGVLNSFINKGPIPSSNPKKGVIINRPNGANVYGPKAVPKDYTGDDVTPQNFANVLTGNKTAMVGKGSGKVLESGPNDHVFVNFVDHGGPGIIGFPSDLMYADDLISALKTMHEKKMYNKLVFYMEACESGSMFDNILPANINIFATTAANPEESSWACYWDETVDAYLGDEYSVAWMEDIDSEEHHKNLTTETLQKQFTNVVKHVKRSHPSMYGEKPIKKEKVKDYIGGNSKNATQSSESSTSLERFQDVVSSRDVALRTLEKKIEKTEDEKHQAELIKKRDMLIKGRRAVDELFDHVLGQMHSADLKTNTHQPITLEMMPCYKTVVDYFSKNCVNITKNTYVLGHLHKLANLCALKTPADDVIKVFSQTCTDAHRGLQSVN